MREVPDNYKIAANEICAKYLKQTGTAIATKECIDSYAQYIRAFCLALATACRRSNTSYCSMINYITLSALPEMTEDEYLKATDIANTEKYDEYLFSEHLIISTLHDYDCRNNMAYYPLLISTLAELAEIFVQTDDNNLLTVDKFVSEFKQKALTVSIKNNASTSRTEEDSKNEQKNDIKVPRQSDKETGLKNETSTAKTINNVGKCKTNEIDSQYFVRIILPTIVAIGICVWAVSTEAYLFLFLAVFPLLITANGVKKSKCRCPQCRAWQSMYVVSQNQIKHDKVKVRRPLGSVYFRSSGRTTYGLRQTFVSAEENTYDAIFRCNVCGYQYRGVYTNIDDKIRG